MYLPARAPHRRHWHFWWRNSNRSTSLGHTCRCERSLHCSNCLARRCTS